MCSGQVISGESLGYWKATATTTEFPALVDEQDVDIAIVGGGIVGWCENDRCWDCPCHGSRFALDGEVLHRPAVRPLKVVKAL